MRRAVIKAAVPPILIVLMSPSADLPTRLPRFRNHCVFRHSSLSRRESFRRRRSEQVYPARCGLTQCVDQPPRPGSVVR